MWVLLLKNLDEISLIASFLVHTKSTSLNSDVLFLQMFPFSHLIFDEKHTVFC